MINRIFYFVDHASRYNSC